MSTGVKDAALADITKRFWDWRMEDSPEFAHVCGVHKPDVLDKRSLGSFQDRGMLCLFLPSTPLLWIVNADGPLGTGIGSVAI